MSESLRLRKRTAATATETGITHSHKSENNDSKNYHPAFSKGASIWKWINLVIHAVAVLCFLLGFVFRVRFDLHSGSECDMTYSMREFLQVEVPHTSTSKAAESYKLYKFVDRRDPRYQRLLHRPQPLQASEHCIPNIRSSRDLNNSSLHLVLYIPGHWGSYSQSRSLGAHGIQLTRARDSSVNTVIQNLASGRWNGNASHLDSFVYEVYAVDFAEQGGALHGAFLKLQSEFVATVLQQMIQDCSHNDEIPRITLVAHSMGGYVARLTMQNQPSLRAHVKNIITLATPHQNPLYAFEPTIHELHQQLAQSGQKASQEIIEDQLIVSISGGLRDEMIDPYAGELPSTHAFQSISVQATFLRNNSHNLSSSLSHTQQESFYLGMDHRAIVWCHQLLMDVRKIIWTLATSDHLSGLERRKKIEIALGIESETGIPYSYMENTHQLHQILKLRLGYFQAVCMESSMMYNLPLLYAFYLFNASLRCSIACLQALPHFSEWRHIFGIASLWLTIMLGFVFTNLSFETSTILGLVGNAANVILMRVITVGFLWRRNARDYIERALGFLCLSFVVVVFVLAWCFRSNKGRVSFWSILDPSVYIWSILATYVVLFVWMGLSSFREWRGFQHCMAANFMLTVPTVMAGPIILGWHEQASRVDSWTTLLALQIPLLAMSAFHLHEQKIGSRDNKALEGSQKLTVLKSILIALVVLIASPQVLSRGSGHVLPTMLEIIAWIDIMSSVVESRWVRK